jgi:hypothetical protein
MLSELQNAKSSSFQKDIHLIMRTTEDHYEKARVRVTLKHKQIGAGLSIQQMHIDANSAGTELQDLLQDTYNMEIGMGDTISGTSNIRCFLNISESGIQLTGTYVPALSFIHGQLPQSNDLFWTNALTKVLERENKDMNWFVNKADKNEQARIAFLFADYPVTILPYLGDQIDRRSRKSTAKIGNVATEEASPYKVGFEQFSQVFALLAGDCEDLAKGGNLCTRTFQRFYKQQQASIGNDLKGKAFERINGIFDQYVIIMSLCVVHGAKADDENMPKGAHMANFALPVKYFKECMEKTEDGKRLASSLPWPKNIEAGYETQTIEGTGMLDPLGYKDPKAYVRQYMKQGEWFRGLKHPMIMEHGIESPFFLGALQGWTTYFCDRGASKGIGGFWFVDPAKQTRGALYTDFTNNKPNVGLRPMPEASPKVQKLMLEANAFALPPQPLVLSKKEDNLKNHLLDKLCENVQALGRKTPPINKQCVVDVFMSPHQLNSKVANGLYQDIKNNLTRVFKVEYKREPVTDVYHGYRLIQYIQTD